MEDEGGTASGSLRTLLRVGTAGLMLGPGVSKFLTYNQSVRFFRTLALPDPEVLVLVVGAVEIAVAVLLLFDRTPRASALTAVPVMLVALVTAGPTWQNLGVLFAALLLVGVDSIVTIETSYTPTARQRAVVCAVTFNGYYIFRGISLSTSTT